MRNPGEMPSIDHKANKPGQMSDDGVKDPDRRRFLGNSLKLLAGAAIGAGATGAIGKVAEAFSPKKEEKKISYEDKKLTDLNTWLNSIDDDLKYIEKKLAESAHNSKEIDELRLKIPAWKKIAANYREKSLISKNDASDIENARNIFDFDRYISNKKMKADLIL